VVSDELWELVEPLLPRRERRFRYPVRRRLPDRQCLSGILYVLHTGIPWHDLPAELGFGSGVTCWRRLEEWQRAGVWDRLQRTLLTKLRAPIASTSAGRSWTPARCRPKRGRQDGPEPGRPGPAGLQAPPPHAAGVPLAVSLSGGNRNDITQLIPLVDAVPAIAGTVGRPRRRPRALVADRGCDHDAYRRHVRRRGIRPLIARRRTAHARAGPAALAGGAQPRLAASVPAPARSIRAPG